jgi:hypothetical protein
MRQCRGPIQDGFPFANRVQNRFLCDPNFTAKPDGPVVGWAQERLRFIPLPTSLARGRLPASSTLSLGWPFTGNQACDEPEGAVKKTTLHPWKSNPFAQFDRP